MHHLLEHINQVIKSKDNDPTVNKTEYRSKRKVDVCENGGLWSKYFFLKSYTVLEAYGNLMRRRKVKTKL